MQRDLHTEGTTFQYVGVSFLPQISGVPNTAVLASGETFELENVNGEKQSWIGFKTPVSSTPFSILRLMTASHAVGKINPVSLLLLR